MRRLIQVFSTVLVMCLPIPVATASPTCAGLTPTIMGTDDHETINGTSGDDVIYAGGGADEINGFFGDDVICAGSGFDQVFGDAGSDVLIGGPDGDQLNGDGRLNEDNNFMVFPKDSGDDRVFGGPGDDQVRGHTGDDRISGGLGDDSLNGSRGSDRISGGEGVDRLTYFEEAGPVEVRLDLGWTTVSGEDPARDTLEGIEDVVGSHYRSVLIGDQGPNELKGGRRGDFINGGDGNDSLLGENGHDELEGGRGLDFAYGDDGNDRCAAEIRRGCENLLPD